MVLFRRFFFFLLILTLQACQENTTTQALHHRAELSIRYLSLDKSLKADVFFQPSDQRPDRNNTVAIDGSVRLNDHLMSLRESGGQKIGYGWQSTVDFPTQFDLRAEFDQWPNTTITNKLLPLGSLKVQERFQRRKGLIFEAEGAELSESESLVILLNGPSNIANTYTIKGPSNTERHALTAEQLEGLVPGTYQLFLVKKQEVNQQVDGLEVTSRIEYFSHPVSIELVDL